MSESLQEPATSTSQVFPRHPKTTPPAPLSFLGVHLESGDGVNSQAQGLGRVVSSILSVICPR
jgi:hypothetical protein